jgi:predicted amidophosphoribosyltransferase
MKEQTATQSADVYREYEPDSPMPSVKKNFCGNCGSELKQGAKFCMKCGKKL